MPIGIFDGDREELTGEFSFYRLFQWLLMLYFDSPDHADDAGALGLLVRPIEVEISAIFIFCVVLKLGSNERDGGLILMGFSC